MVVFQVVAHFMFNLKREHGSERVTCNYILTHFSLKYIVPIDATQGIKMLYVFVDIKLDTVHLLDTIRHNFKPGTSLSLVSTIQFVATLQV